MTANTSSSSMGTLRLTCLVAKSIRGSALLVSPRLLPAVSGASIVSLAKQDASFKRPPPYDYKNKRYTKLHVKFPFLDPTWMRFNPNSKVICVEGNIGSGKATFAKELADKFGWHYLSEPRIEERYVNHNGFDYRTLNKYINPKLWAFDDKMFWENPKHEAVSWWKILVYHQKYIQYIDALAYLFNTGQGVVLERCPASDFVFADAMKKSGWLPQDTYDFYYRVRYDSIHMLLRPHLIIYLDKDPDVCLEDIKKQGVPHKVNSPVLTSEYLGTIADSYMTKYLPDARQFSELLVYKWNKPDENFDQIVLDIEKLEIDNWDTFQKKFKDWNFYWNEFYDTNRYTYTSMKMDLMQDFAANPIYDVDSLAIDGNDADHRDKVYDSFVPNYKIDPQWDRNRVGWWGSVFNREKFRVSEDFSLRGPFY